MKQILLGTSDFKKFFEQNGYYVDKTLLINEIINIPGEVKLITRPRRFGKTLNLSMLYYFFDIRHPENIELFKKLKIWNNQDLINNHCCKYPVIYLTFKNSGKNYWEGTFNIIKNRIINFFKDHIYLLESDVLYDFEKKRFEKILNEEAKTEHYETSLVFLSELLYRYYRKPTIILIDEYDEPLHRGYDKYYEKVITFMRIFLGDGLKDNKFLFRAIITGILRVSKESIFSGLNNIKVFSVLNHEMGDKFGFTEQEVKQLLDYYQKPEYFEQVKQWYNGYRIGKTENIYNPWSILNFIADSESEFKDYWTQTSTNDLIKQELLKPDAIEIRDELAKLLEGQTIEKPIYENFIFTELKTKKKLLWTLMLFAGYLTFTEWLGENNYKLRIPNRELQKVYRDTIIEWLEEELSINGETLKNTLRALLEGRLDDYEKGLRKIMQDKFSYFDIPYFNEQIFKAYLLGLLAILGDEYELKSDRESGEGRYDLIIIPRNKNKNQKAILIEIKRIEKKRTNESIDRFKARINKALNQALQQIDEKQYCKELLNRGWPDDRILKVAIVFAGKEPYVRGKI